MSRTISLVQQVQIASPCTAAWDEMIGDDKSRFCSQCKLNVYNLSAMTQEKGDRLMIEKEGKLCARIYRRFDGTIITRDCPVGLRAIHRRMMWFGIRTVAALIAITIAVANAIGMLDDQYDLYEPVFYGSLDRTDTYRQTVISMRRWLISKSPQVRSVMLGTPAPFPPTLQANLDALVKEAGTQSSSQPALQGSTSP